MNHLPDIVREEKILSGNNNKFIDEFFPSTSFCNFDFNFDPNQKKTHYKKNNGSFINNVNKTNLISNNMNGRTSFARASRSTDFLNVKNSPLATNYMYNWKPHQRLTSKAVQAKVKIYKPPKRIEMTGRPSSPYKVKSDYETKEPTFHNEKRTYEMKKLQYMQAHSNWSIYPYAGIEEREDYK